MNGNRTLLDWKIADVNGDGILDNVYLYGHVDEQLGNLAENITLVIRDGRSNKITEISLINNAGYNARLFLGDFNQDNIVDIMISADTGGSGGNGIFYIYSFRNNVLQELLDVDQYNATYLFEVHYEDFYKVRVESRQLNVVFTIDISNKGADYLSQFYNQEGILKEPVIGGALAISALNPIITNNKSYNYDVLAFQRIIGTVNVDTLGYVENLMTWNGDQFVSKWLSLLIAGEKLISS
ncbi:VCBS repeat-containing protein [Sporosarcina sp. Marseille-Q4063]|uniref:VCBS repeat-containing protein n=1 Tax=Sporosarcina sp. Marseille-Q4063 TaxID=2810514 RepID=UPI0020166FBA|nr:VCBS repeat-containing protein [Sporosarcina sp. Marseille-Q4063]